MVNNSMSQPQMSYAPSSQKNAMMHSPVGILGDARLSNSPNTITGGQA